MLTIKEYVTKYPDALSAEDLDRILDDPKEYEDFLMNHLLEPDDNLNIRVTETPIGVRKEFIATKPNGKWRKDTMIIPNPDATYADMVKEQTITAYKWLLAGKRLEDWELANPGNISKIHEAIVKLSKEDRARAEEEYRRDDMIFSYDSN